MPTVTSFGLDRIGQIAINVHDVERATAFYRDTLGMRFLFRAGDMAFFDCGGVRLLLGTATSPEHDHPASIVYYKVDDIAAAHAELVARGVAFEQAPHVVADLGDRELWLAFFRDPESNVVALMAEPLKA
ncbi:MAG: VOC family protein [Gemmatimonadetes bacterium]|nr:VOC family protein [Gemmatimonadota bacterium]